MDGKLNNPSWICDELQEKIEEYEKRADGASDGNVRETYLTIIEELKQIMYE